MIAAPETSEAVSAFLTARVARQRFTVTAINMRLVGGTVIADVQLANGETATLRIARAKAKWLFDELSRVLG
jgi:hypothetical protein